MARQSILKFAIPFATVSTSFLLFTFKSAKAATLTNIILQKRGVLSHDYVGNSHGILGFPKSVIHNIDVITSKLVDIMDWLNNLPVSLPKYTADLLTLIFHFLSKLTLETPLFLFNNPYLKNTSLTFAAISITIVTLLTVFEAIMQMLNKKHTDFKTILKRWAIVASVSGFMPFLFEAGFTYLNKLSESITKIGVMGSNQGFITGVPTGWFETLVIILFDLTAISLLIPVALQAARKWFDLLCLCAISPLALASWCFKRHEHYFFKWLDEVKLLSLTQLVHAVYIVLMGIAVFTIGGIHGGIFTLIIKTLLVIAGMNKLTHPPQFVKRMTDSGSDVFDQYDKTKNMFKDIYNTVTFKNFRPAQFLKDRKEKKLAQVKNLQKKYKRRFVKDLM